MKICIVILLYGLILTDVSLGRQHYNANSDFLLHEGAISTGPKRGDVTPQPTTSSLSAITKTTNQGTEKRDYVADFPPLRPVSSQSNSNVNINAGTTIQNPQSNSGKRDYVANFPPLRPVSSQSNNNVNINAGATIQNPQSNSGKRDYVAPQYPTLKPIQTNSQSTGKVKDLINFYDHKNKEQNLPQGAPSYSSIAQGSPNKNNPSSTTTITTQKPSTPTRPMSFSSVVAGSNKHGSQTPTTITTSKPTTRYPNNPSPARPGSPVLPSSILNNNKNTNPSNSNGPSDIELQTLSEELLRKDINNAAKYITINYQEKTTSYSKEDKAPLPLLTISPEVWNITTIQTFVPLLDNYERDTLINEYVTPQERNEENAFMDAIMATSVIRHLMNFLKDKGYVTPDPKQQRDYLKQLWFSLYSRGKGKISSSGFEHVFVSEYKNDGVLGLHNWIYFSKEEAANRLNYLGYMKYVQLNDKGVLMKLHFSHHGADKPVNSLMIGTSPELEISLYTLCFVTRADNECKLKLANKDVNIVTYTFRYRSKNLIGSAFPQI